MHISARMFLKIGWGFNCYFDIAYILFKINNLILTFSFIEQMCEIILYLLLSQKAQLTPDII